MNPPKFVISVLCLNRLSATRKCLEAVFRHGGDFDVIVTDNGSTDGTREWLQDLAHRTLRRTFIFNEKNEGFIPPNNFAFHLAARMGATYFVCLNNDTEPPAGWLDKLAEPLDKSPTAALSGPQGTCSMIGHNFRGGDGPRYEYVEGSCLCVKIEIARQWPDLFSDYLDFIYGDDSDLSLRVREKGYTIHQVPFVMPHTRGETVFKDHKIKERCMAAESRNHVVLRRRWSHYLRVRKMNYPILIRRAYAKGDVLLLTPIIRAIKESNPLSDIYVETDFPDILDGNPHVKHVSRQAGDFPDGIEIDLNNSYENYPLTHIIHAYEEEVRKQLPGLGKVELRTEMFEPLQDREKIAQAVRDAMGGRDKLMVIHADYGGWPGKNWPLERFVDVANWQQSQGWAVAYVGQQECPDYNAIDWTRKTSTHWLAAVLRHADLFLGGDSFPMHVAQAAGCPTIGLFGVTRSRYIMTNGSPHIGIDGDSNIPCAGLRHKTQGLEHLKCSSKCIESITVPQVLDAIERIKK